jgi:hypothetical protein
LGVTAQEKMSNVNFQFEKNLFVAKHVAAFDKNYELKNMYVSGFLMIKTQNKFKI